MGISTEAEAFCSVVRSGSVGCAWSRSKVIGVSYTALYGGEMRSLAVRRKGMLSAQ